ncbi:MAG: hydantoinase/oxoprolinase family protein [Desulfobacteraceae bacterium]|nr:hydantoinase/oxoprolinase family protein [Desulfobacteraceae bacterium]
MIIGLDVGGTHTDVVLIGEAGLLRQAKVATDHSNLFECVLAGLEQVTKDVPSQSIRRAVLSTTLTTNAIAEGKLAPTGMIVSSGPGIDPDCFRTGEHYYAVSGSIDHRGREVQPISESEVRKVAGKLQADGIRQVGVVSKFSTRNPKHEMRIAEILGKSFDYVVLGHRLSGNLNFPRRIATAYLNGAVHPVHKQFFEAVRHSLAQKGLDIPIFVLKADGGTICFEASMDTPGQTILSGPAASVMGSLLFASETVDTLVLDIGGTTTDMAVLVRRIPLLEPLGGEIGGYKTLIRSLRTESIGLGGDSTVRLANGEIQIGPDRQGPAMAYGGSSPTPTDALFVLGRARDGNAEAARRGLQPIADRLDVSVEQLSHRVFDLACTKIVDAARKMIDAINSKPVYTVRELLAGYQVEPREILVLGGPAPFFAQRLAQITGLQANVVPQWHVANAIGAALAKTTSEISLFADTDRGIAVAPEEDYQQQIKRDFNKQNAIELACHLLRKKCIKAGADEADLEIEVIEEIQFNMVRDFYTAGRNIRVKVQVKPGLIREYPRIAKLIFNYCPLPGAI